MTDNELDYIAVRYHDHLRVCQLVARYKALRDTARRMQNYTSCGLDILASYERDQLAALLAEKEVQE